MISLPASKCTFTHSLMFLCDHYIFWTYFWHSAGLFSECCRADLNSFLGFSSEASLGSGSLCPVNSFSPIRKLHVGSMERSVPLSGQPILICSLIPFGNRVMCLFLCTLREEAFLTSTKYPMPQEDQVSRDA